MERKRNGCLTDHEGAHAGGVVEVLGAGFREDRVGIAIGPRVVELLLAGDRVKTREDHDVKIFWHTVGVLFRFFKAPGKINNHWVAGGDFLIKAVQTPASGVSNRGAASIDAIRSEWAGCNPIGFLAKIVHVAIKTAVWIARSRHIRGKSMKIHAAKIAFELQRH